MEGKKIQIQGGVLAAACLALVVSLTSVTPPLSNALLVAVFAAAIAVPTNMLLFLSPDLSSGSPPFPPAARWHLRCISLAFLSAYLSVAALFWHFSVFASVGFLFLSLLSFLFLRGLARAKRERGQ